MLPSTEFTRNSSVVNALYHWSCFFCSGHCPQLMYPLQFSKEHLSTKWSSSRVNSCYGKTSNIRRTLVGNERVDHWDVVGASPVGAAPTTSSFSTWHLATRDSAKKAARQYKNLLSGGIWCVLYKRLDGNRVNIGLVPLYATILNRYEYPAYHK